MNTPSYSKNYDGQSSDETFTDTRLFPDHKSITFASLEDAKRGIAEYCRTSGFFLKFFKSEPSRGRLVAQCLSHEDCTFGVQIGRNRKTHELCIKKIDHIHKTKIAMKEEGQRNFRKRLEFDVVPYVSTVESVKDGPVVPKDVIKASNKSGDDLNYDVASRGLQKWKGQRKTGERMSYQQISGYLRSFESSNPGSCVDVQVNEENELTHVFCCPGFMDEILHIVKPVIQLDACHKFGIWGGTLFLVTVFSGCQDVYPIAMALTAENESERTWRYVLEHLREACPVLSEFDGPCHEELAGQDEPEPLEDGYSGDEGRNEEILSQRRLFRFGAISDRDKGMRKAFEEVFPSIFLWNCAMHIKRNVQDRFGTSCGDEVIDIAKTFSKSVEAQLFERLRNKNAAAERYLKGIDPKVWRSTAM